MDNQKCERCLEWLPLVATVKAATYKIRVCRSCGKEAERLEGRAPGPIMLKWDKKQLRTGKPASGKARKPARS